MCIATYITKMNHKVNVKQSHVTVVESVNVKKLIKTRVDYTSIYTSNKYLVEIYLEKEKIKLQSEMVYEVP